MKKITFLSLSICFLSLTTTAQTEINVPADFSTIQAAVNAASNNDVIMVANGAYNESVNLNTGPNGISIIAENPNNATINGGNFPAFIASSHTGDITITGFVLTSTLNSNASGVISMTNLTGRLTVINNTISTGNTNGIWHRNIIATETNISVLNNSFGDFGNDDFIRIQVGEDSVGGGNSNIVIDGNTNTGIAQDDAIQIDLESSNSNATIIITNNSFSGWTASGRGIRFHHGNGSPVPSNSEVHMTIANNTIQDVDGFSVVIDLDGTNNYFFGTISDNTITGDSVDSVSGIYIDSDSTIDGVTATINIENNIISNLTTDGIRIRPFNDAANRDTWNFVINNNTITNVGETGINITDSSGADDENYTINAEITNNTISSFTDCIIIARPTSTVISTAIINYEASGNSCAPTLLGSPTSATDPVPNTLDLLEIGNLVWHDSDGDGLNNNGELGVEGVVISFSGNGFLGSTSTNVNGRYTLPSLTPGTYTLTATSTLAFPDVTIQNAGGDTSIDSDFNPTTKTVNVTLIADSTNNTSIDLGILDSSTLSITDLQSEPIRVYPNPVTNQFTIKTQLTDYTYSIYSLEGRLISSKISDNNLQLVDFSSFSSGLYLLKIKANNKERTFRLIKD